MPTTHPPPPHAAPSPTTPAAGETSERVFRRRIIKAVTTLNLRDMRAMWQDEGFQPHMHLFVMLVVAFTMGILIWILVPA